VLEQHPDRQQECKLLITVSIQKSLSPAFSVKCQGGSMLSLDSFNKAYDTEITEVVVRERKFHILLPKSLAGFIDTDNVYLFQMTLKDMPVK
jgi:hypothetical protein